MTALDPILRSAKAGTVIELPPLVPALSAEKVVLTVLENAAHAEGRRLTYRLHWHGVMIGQKALIVPTLDLKEGTA